MIVDPFLRFLGASCAAEAARAFGRRAAAVDAPVLLLGESGTGKGILARAIHDASRRARAPFVAVNCAAVPDSLFESEFFGHVRGAFTGAQYGHKGLFEQAHAGTLFLDEVGELPLPAQAKLLTAIEDREVRRLGGERVQAVNVRIIAATARNLAAAVAGGEFRRDLFHRLSVLAFQIAPLRQRHGDLAELADHLLARISERYQLPRAGCTPAVLERLGTHDWPGNVRELANTLERAVLTSAGHSLSAAAVSLASRATLVREQPAPPPRSRYSFAGTPAEEIMEIRAAIQRCRGNKTRAAELLGMSRNTLLNKLRRHATPACCAGVLAATLAACGESRSRVAGIDVAVERVHLEDAVHGTIGRAFDFTVVDGDVFILDVLEHRVARLARSADGWHVTATFGQRGNGPGELTEAVALAYDERADHVVVLERSGELELFDPDGRYVRSETVNLPCVSARARLLVIADARLVAQRCIGHRFAALAGDTAYMLLARVGPNQRPELLAAQAVATLSGDWGSIYTADSPVALVGDSIYFGGGVSACIMIGTLADRRLRHACERDYERFSVPKPAGFPDGGAGLAARWPDPLPVFAALASTTTSPVLLRMFAEDSLVLELLGARSRFVAIAPLDPLVGCNRDGCLWFESGDAGGSLRLLTGDEMTHLVAGSR